MLANIYFVQGKLHESLDEYQDAIDNYNKYYEMNPTSYFIHSFISRCYRHLEEYDKAEEEITISLKYRPFDPITNYEAAILYFDMGEDDKGLEYLRRAVDIWKDADSEYEKANIAKDKLSSLQ